LISLEKDEEAVKIKSGEAVLEGNIYDVQTALDNIRHEHARQELGIEAANNKLLALESELSNAQFFENQAQWAQVEAGIWPRLDELEGILMNLKDKSGNLKTDLNGFSSIARSNQDATIRIDGMISLLHRLDESLKENLKDLQQYKANYKKG